MLSLNEKLSEVQLLHLRATFDALPLFHLGTYILRAYARKNCATLEINPKRAGARNPGYQAFMTHVQSYKALL